MEELNVRSTGKLDCGDDWSVDLNVPSLDPDEIQDTIASADRPVVLRFGKHFCGWTKTLDSVLAQVIGQLEDKADFYTVNLPDYPQLYATWNISTSPMTILIKDGEEVARTDAAEDFEILPVLEEWFLAETTGAEA